MLGISGPEFLVLLVVAAIVLGPERLPQYTQQLARLVRELRRMAQGATEQVRSELGPEFDDIDWRKLDPRQYDPRRIVREALSDTFDPNDPLGFDPKDPLGLKSPAAGTSANGTGASANGTSVNGASSASTTNQAGSAASAGDGAAATDPAGASAAPRFDPDAT